MIRYICKNERAQFRELPRYITVTEEYELKGKKNYKLMILSKDPSGIKQSRRDTG